MIYYLLLYYSALYFLFASIVFCGILLLIVGEHIASRLLPDWKYIHPISPNIPIPVLLVIQYPHIPHIRDYPTFVISHFQVPKMPYPRVEKVQVCKIFQFLHPFSDPPTEFVSCFAHSFKSALLPEKQQAIFRSLFCTQHCTHSKFQK